MQRFIDRVFEKYRPDLLDDRAKERGAAAVLAMLVLMLTTMTGIDAGRAAALDIRIAGAVSQSQGTLALAETAMEEIRWDYTSLTNTTDACTPASSTLSKGDPASPSSPCLGYRAVATFGTCEREGSAMCEGLETSEQYFRTLNWQIEASGYTLCSPTTGAVRRLRANAHAVVLAPQGGLK